MTFLRWMRTGSRGCFRPPPITSLELEKGFQLHRIAFKKQRKSLSSNSSVKHSSISVPQKVNKRKKHLFMSSIFFLTTRTPSSPSPSLLPLDRDFGKISQDFLKWALTCRYGKTWIIKLFGFSYEFSRCFELFVTQKINM